MANKNSEYQQRWRDKNREAYNAYMRNWRAANPDKLKARKTVNNKEARRKYHLKAKYGITPEQYNALLTAQDGVCAICKQPEFSIRRGSYKSLDVDHNHDTGQVRGLLCSACNASLGLLKEDLKRVKSLLTYIKHWNS